MAAGKLIEQVNQFRRNIEAEKKTRASAYFLDFAEALSETIQNLPPDNHGLLDKAIAEKPAETIRPFHPGIGSMAECLEYAAGMAGTDYARSKHKQALKDIIETASPALVDALKEDYGDRFTSLEPLILHNLALNLSRLRAENRLNAEVATDAYYHADVSLPELDKLKHKTTGHTARGFTAQKDEAGYHVEAAQMKGKRDYQEDHIMLVKGNAIPAQDVPGRLMQLFQKANDTITARREGTTACVACISGGRAVIANTGDSRAFMLLEPVKDDGSYDASRRVECVRLSAEHRPDDAGEICRVEMMGAKSLTGHARLPDYSRVLEPKEDNAPDLATHERPGLGAARAIGDRVYEGRVSWIPELTQVDLRQYISNGYKVHICLASDGMHFPGAARHEPGGGEKFTRGLYEQDYARLLEAFRTQASPPVYDNMAKLFTDYAHDRHGSDNMSMQVLTYDGKSNQLVSGGVFDGHGGAKVAEQSAEIIGGGLGEFIPLRAVAAPPPAVQKIVAQGAAPAAQAAVKTPTLINTSHIRVVEGDDGYRVQVDVSHLQEPQREQVRTVLNEQLEDIGITFRAGGGGAHLESDPARAHESKANSDSVGVKHCCKLLPSGPAGGMGGIT